MARKPPPKSPKKETITPPTKRELTDASKALRKGHPSGGRVMAEKAVAVKQRAIRPKGRGR